LRGILRSAGACRRQGQRNGATPPYQEQMDVPAGEGKGGVGKAVGVLDSQQRGRAPKPIVWQSPEIEELAHLYESSPKRERKGEEFGLKLTIARTN